jgi:5-methylcytosine-specific restriction endonuclease McrA
LEEKHISEFYNDKSKPNGKKPRCKPCDAMSIDRERRSAYEKAYWSERKEKKKAIQKASMARNADHHREKRKDYLQTPSGKASYRRYTQTRRARTKSAFVEYVDPLQVYIEQDGRCYICGTDRPLSQMHLDHCVPIAAGGLHERENCGIACARCNLSKGAKPLSEVMYQVV